MKDIMCNKQECCGCGACASICPQSNIVMKQDEEGFFYPEIVKEECLECGRCISVCPIKKFEQTTDELQQKEFYAGVINDDVAWERCASGGAFEAICKTAEEKSPIVFGAKWDGLKVVMDSCEGIENIAPFHKSKYVSADSRDIYTRVKKYLKDNRYVIFSGTPCQINGLRNYLGKEYENLLLVDFACHGQGSPVIFQKWIDFLQRKTGRRIKTFQFREKRYIKDHVNSNCCSYLFDDGEKIVKYRDPYHHCYVSGNCMRPSCMKCEFANKRNSDITLADFKNLRAGLPDYQGKKTVSTIITNTVKGSCIVRKLQGMEIFYPEEVFVLKYNPKLYRDIPGNRSRDEFMRHAIVDNKCISRLFRDYSPILPSQYVEANYSTNIYKRFSKVLAVLDIAVFQYKKWKRKIMYKSSGQN